MYPIIIVYHCFHYTQAISLVLEIRVLARPLADSLVPRLLFTEGENSPVNYLHHDVASAGL